MVDGTWTPNHYGGPRSNFNDMSFSIKNPDQRPINMVEAGFKVPQRWSKFLKDYLDVPTFRGFMSNIWSSQPGQSITYYTVPVAGHSLGNCVQSLNVLGQKPYRLQMTNRTAQISPIASLDITFLCEAAKIASELLQLDYCMPVIWNCHSIQCHVVEAGHIYAYRDLLKWVRKASDSDVSWTSREVMKHVQYALDHKTTAWKTFERAWKKTRDRMERHKSGTISDLGTFYGTIPTHMWSPFVEGHNNAEELEAKYGMSRKWIRHRVRPLRAMMNYRWGYAFINIYDLVWKEDHPEFMVLMHVYINGGSVESIGELCEALDVETEEEAKAYCDPFYQTYNK